MAIFCKQLHSSSSPGTATTSPAVPQATCFTLTYLALKQIGLITESQTGSGWKAERSRDGDSSCSLGHSEQLPGHVDMRQKAAQMGLEMQQDAEIEIIVYQKAPHSLPCLCLFLRFVLSLLCAPLTAPQFCAPSCHRTHHMGKGTAEPPPGHLSCLILGLIIAIFDHFSLLTSFITANKTAASSHEEPHIPHQCSRARTPQKQKSETSQDRLLLYLTDSAQVLVLVSEISTAIL